ncbi:MAG: PIN domain-containing protein [Proteobacteria bacterium]|nr:PIN domain-containing protein [Pseudomonadota bacterium]
MNTAILDTNVILRYLLKDNAKLFEQAKPFMDALKTGQNQAYILEGVLVECVYVLLKVYQIPRQEIADALGGVLDYSGIVGTDKKRLKQSLKFFSKHNVDIVDALIYATAIERGLEIFSFDKDIKRLKRIYEQ